MADFYGEYTQVIDAKNRVFIPSKYRDELSETIYIAKGVDESEKHYLVVYPEELWLETKQKIMSIASVKRSNAARFLFSSVVNVKCDAHGRVLLPQNLVDYANFTKDIYVIGVGDRIEIWDKAERDADQSEDMIAEIVALMKEYDI